MLWPLIGVAACHDPAQAEGRHKARYRGRAVQA